MKIGSYLSYEKWNFMFDVEFAKTIKHFE